KHSDSEEVFYLAIAQFFDRRVGGGTLDAAVPASVIACAVAIVFAVYFVVFRVVGNHVVQSESVVAGDEVDALFGFAALMGVDLGAPHNPVRDTRHRAIHAAEKIADIISESSVPLLPTVSHEASHLIKTGRVPGLGNHLGTCEHGVGLDVPQHRRVG